MNILVTGSTGFVGSALVPFLIREGHSITRLVRPQTRLVNGHARWNPEAGEIDAGRLAGIEGVVHLAGESLASGRWTPRQKARILDSRVRGTRLLCETLTRLDPPPKAVACASAKDYYGDRGDEIVGEDSPPGSGFLADVVRQWEAATEPASQAGIRVVNLRSGLVLGPRGPLLARMVPPFKLGLGGRLGNGAQVWSWVSLEDMMRAIYHALTTEALEGPVNVAAPRVVTNAEFTKTLGRVLSRPTPFAAPAFALRLVLGEMIGPLLASTQLDSSKLLASGFEFRHPELESALRAMLGK